MDKTKKPSLRTLQRRAKNERKYYEDRNYLILPWFPVHPDLVSMLVGSGLLPEEHRDDLLWVRAAIVRYVYWECCDRLDEAFLDAMSFHDMA